ncbi:response regulator [Cohnella caldifontis]|uniref:response regulator n=1 Tax=Cohnella caldifontis TaxID=3027471 RepID=UPI0023ECD4EA|nr:response regulator [Cohnella sp. YIM B05605]
MYKVCLLDDQPFVREGLRSIIDWNGLDCEIAGEWDTAVTAVRELERIRPDILISDIVMPGLDGLALMDMLNRTGMSVKVVFLSAYRNFEYAHKAIELGAVDYLVKPTDPNEVVRAVLKCIHRIEGERAAWGASAAAPATAPDKGREQEMLSLLVRGAPETPARIDPRLCYSVMMLNFENGAAAAPIMERSAELIRRKLKLDLPPDVLPIFDKIAVVVAGPDPEELQRQTSEWAEEIQFWHRQLLDMTVSIGISSVQRGTGELHRQYAESLKALEQSFYYGKGSIFTAPVEAAPTAAADDGPSLGLKPNKAELLLEVILKGDEERLAYWLDVWFEEFVKERTDPDEAKFEVCKWILYIIPHLQPEADKPLWEKEARSILALQSLPDIKERLTAIYGRMIAPYKSSLSGQHQQVILQVAQYIKRHFRDPDASLTGAAESVHLSGNYLSRLIKRSTGKTFTELLNEHRMEEAKKLLSAGNGKSYWVAEQVGIPDARYFSQLFRKYTNMTPSEFKNQSGSVEKKDRV